ncbi:MAG: CRISPR-associated endonuclease Cas2 [Spirochaetota bacterium]
MNKCHWIISYDVRDAKRLRRVAKFLEGYGDRLQLSLFKVKVSERDLQKIKFEVTKLTEAEDSVMYLQFCEKCSQRVKSFNPKLDWDSDTAPYKIF